MPPEFYQDDFDLFIEEFQQMQRERGKERLVVRWCWPAWVIEAEPPEPQVVTELAEANSGR